MENIDILRKLEKGQIDIDEAIALIKKRQNARKLPKAFLKINIRNGESDFL